MYKFSQKKILILTKYKSLTKKILILPRRRGLSSGGSLTKIEIELLEQ